MYALTYTQMVPKTYSVAEGRAHLSDMLDEFEAGREVQLARREVPAAVVVSAETCAALRGERLTFRDACRVFLEQHPVADIDLDEDFFGVLRRAP
jgi:antitoxin (DNA-binding transcriptional repressor) of toxin-antitoxin stability system